MPKRYEFLDQSSLYETFDQVRHAFLAAKDGQEVDAIIDAVLTPDEKIKIGRRILTASLLVAGFSYFEISDMLKVGNSTILDVEKKLILDQGGFAAIFSRRKKVDREFKDRAYRKVGPSKQVHKRTVYTGFKRRDVKR